MIEKISTLFCDVGGVLLTNGWDHHSRVKASEVFGFDAKEFEGRHQMVFGNYEAGKLTLDEYLHYVLFYQPRAFSAQAFKEFMYAQSQPYQETIDWLHHIKIEHQLKVVIISNEGRELTQYRLKTFGIDQLADFFLVSSFVGIRKPDRFIYKMAMDTVQSPPEKIAYIDDRQLFTEVAQEFGLKAIHHKDLISTRKWLEPLLQNP